MAQTDDHLTVRQFYPLMALMLGYALLMMAGGMNSLIIPIRGNLEGFSALSLGLLGTSWAIGFITGTLFVPHLVARVGHIRVFAVMASLATVAVILSALVVHPVFWVPSRAAAGFCFAGAAMIVEAWLNERTSASTRGRVFGIYTMVNLGATTIGQMLIVAGDSTGYLFFLVAAVLYTLATIPPALSAVTKPKALRTVSFDHRELWRNSPIAVVSVFLIGISNGAFGTLGAVFGQRIDLGIAAVATFMSVSILAGAAVQIPVGYLSDRFDRRGVLIIVAVVAAIMDLFFLLTTEYNMFLVIAAGAVFGGAIYSLPPIAMAHANDLAPKDRYVQTSSGLLMMFGCGAIVGPVLAGGLMSVTGERGLFYVTLMAHGAIIVYAIWRSAFYRTKIVPQEKKCKFTRMEPGRVVMQPTELSTNHFGVDHLEDHVAPVLPDRIRDAFATKTDPADKEENLHRGQPGDSTHGGW